MIYDRNPYESPYDREASLVETLKVYMDTESSIHATLGIGWALSTEINTNSDIYANGVNHIQMLAHIDTDTDIYANAQLIVTTIGKLFRNILIADPTVGGLVVTGAEQRIYPRNLPLNSTVPAISYTVPSKPKNDITAVTNPRIRYLCFSEDPDEANRLAEAVSSALNHYSGVSGSLEVVHTTAENTIEQDKDAAENYSTIVDIIAVVRGG